MTSSWEQLKEESLDDFRAFNEYLIWQPPRGHFSIARKLGMSWGRLEELAQRHNWRERAVAWDEHLLTVRRKAIETETQETSAAMARRHARAWQKTHRLAERELDKLDHESNVRPDRVLTPREIIQWLGDAYTAERLAMSGAPDPSPGLDLTGWSSDDIEALRELITRNQRNEP